jgi:nucleotide-binding universal stress UspA family protein
MTFACSIFSCNWFVAVSANDHFTKPRFHAEHRMRYRPDLEWQHVHQEEQMKPIKKIMVAIDFSVYSLPSLQIGAKLATALQAELLLVNVTNERDLYIVKKVSNQFSEFLYEKYIEQNEKDRQNQLDNLIKAAGSENLTVKSVFRMGVPFEELLKTIDEEKPDMLVMATKGRSNLADTIVGSCAQKMFRRSPIPLLIIREEDQE